MTRWDAFSTLSSNGRRREVFMFASGHERLYGSLYAPDPTEPRFGIVICSPWGWEFSRMIHSMHLLAGGVARLGGAALLFHWPGHGDSSGAPEECTLPRMVDAVVDAVSTASERVTLRGWSLSGVRLGASAATLATDVVRPPFLLFVEPSLDPPAFYSELDRAGRRSGLGRWLGQFGDSVPSEVRRSGEGAAVPATLERYAGRGAVIRYASSPQPEVPPRFETVTVAGNWWRNAGSRQDPLIQSALRHLRPAMSGAA